MLPSLILHAGSFSWTEWVVYPDFLIGWLLFGGTYLLCVGPLRDRFTGSAPVGKWRIASFVGGMLLMFLALQGPLHELSDYFLFSAHMVQHLLIMLVVPPLLMIGTPDWLLRPIFRIRPIGQFARLITKPVAAIIIANLLFGIWHFPAPYDLMMRDHTVHKGMHLMIMAVGVILWWPVSSPVPEVPRLPGPVQLLYLFILGIPMMAVAVTITWADTHLYAWYALAPRITSLSPMEDQLTGGLIMWVPGALVMWIGISLAYFRWSRREMAEDEAEVGIDTAGTSGMVIAATRYPGES